MFFFLHFFFARQVVALAAGPVCNPLLWLMPSSSSLAPSPPNNAALDLLGRGFLFAVRVSECRPCRPCTTGQGPEPSLPPSACTVIQTSFAPSLSELDGAVNRAQYRRAYSRHLRPSLPECMYAAREFGGACGAGVKLGAGSTPQPRRRSWGRARGLRRPARPASTAARCAPPPVPRPPQRRWGGRRRGAPLRPAAPRCRG